MKWSRKSCRRSPPRHARARSATGRFFFRALTKRFGFATTNVAIPCCKRVMLRVQGEESEGSMKNSATVCLTLVMLCLFAIGALAQTLGGNAAASGAGAANEAQSARIAKLEQAVADAKSSGDNAWM